MSKYIKCIEEDCVPLSAGVCYNIVSADDHGYLVLDDNKELNWYSILRFESPIEVQEPITFASQQEFEDAVMKAVMQRLSVFEWREGWKTHFGMEDSEL